MKCKDCEYFKILMQPSWDDFGKAVCLKYDLITEFTKGSRKFERLECVEDAEAQNQARETNGRR